MKDFIVGGKRLGTFALIVALLMLSYFFAGDRFKAGIQKTLPYDFMWLFLLMTFVACGLLLRDYKSRRTQEVST